MTVRLVTIGVYGFALEEFLAALRSADVRLLLDVRQRRGVRGPGVRLGELEAAPGGAGRPPGSPTSTAPSWPPRPSCARLQYAEDDRQGVGKRSRAELAPAYRERYIAEILDKADLDDVIDALPERRRRSPRSAREARPRGLPPLADRRANRSREPHRDRPPPAVLTGHKTPPGARYWCGNGVG